MLFNTLNQYIVLALLFVVGWLFGLASHSGGRKWRERLKAESEQHAAYRHDTDAQLKEAQRRGAELERDNAALEKHRIASQASIATLEAQRDGAGVAGAGVAAAASDQPPSGRGEDTKKSWFGAGGKDDLTRIRGIDATTQSKLRDLGVKSFGDVEALSPEDESELEQRIAIPAGQISRDQWREQAVALREGQ